MKFLCDNCKAKYQIADEKVAGRTLRMKCRKCGHSILIRGRHLRPSSAPASSSPGALRRGAARASVAPPDAAPVPDQWHVAINDVPVGPIRKDEIARKIAAGAVRGDSLVWREGFDDWRPLRTVPELRRLLTPTGSVPAPVPRPPAPAPAARASRPGTAASQPPAANVVPIGGRMGGGAAVAFDRGAPETLEDPTVLAPAPTVVPDAAPPPSEPSVPPTAVPDAAPPPSEAAAAVFAEPPPSEPEDAPAAPRGPRVAGMPPFAWMAVVGAGAFGVTLAVVLGVRMSREPAPAAPTPASVATAPVAEQPAAEQPVAEQPAAGQPAAEQPVAEQPAAGQPDPSSKAVQRIAKRAGSPRGARSAKGKGGKQLSAEEAARLARFAGGAGRGRALPARGGTLSGGSRRAGGGKPLEPQQLARVVGKNKSQLGACYNRAIRGMGDPPTVRVDVRIKVGASGAVTHVGVNSSNALPGMERCIRNTVRRWRFPASGAGGEVKFPLVFQGG